MFMFDEDMKITKKANLISQFSQSSVIKEIIDCNNVKLGVHVLSLVSEFLIAIIFSEMIFKVTWFTENDS